MRSRIRKVIAPHISPRMRRLLWSARFLGRQSPLYEVPLLVEKPAGSRVLVVSPHPDDEVIGCGGTIAKHAAAGDDILCLYLTNGGTSLALLDVSPAERRRIRVDESKRIKSLLGITEQVFLDPNGDGVLRNSRKSLRQIEQILCDFRPDLVYVPFFLDIHKEHVRANDMLLAAAERCGANFDCCGYEVWSLLHPNILVDISSHMKTKIRALQEYKTALKVVDYVRSVTGLNMFRSATSTQGKGFAEAFLLLGLARYREVFTMWRRDSC